MKKEIARLIEFEEEQKKTPSRLSLQPYQPQGSAKTENRRPSNLL